MTRRIGLAALTVLELPPAQQVTVAAEAGYDFVSLRLIPIAGQAVVHPLDIVEVEKRLAGSGLEVLDVEVFRLEAGTNVTDFEPALADAQRLGARQLLAHGADRDEARLAENFGRLCELASRHGIDVNLEPMPWIEISTAAKAKRLLAAAGTEGAGLLVDPIHFFRAENNFEDLEGAPVNYLQFCDARAERPADTAELMRQARTDRLLPGEGGLDLRRLLRALPAGLPMALEIPLLRVPDPLQRAKQALAATRNFLAHGES